MRSGNSLEDFADPEQGWGQLGENVPSGAREFFGFEPARAVAIPGADGKPGPRPTPPLFRSLAVDYTTDGIAAAGAQVRVWPNSVPMGLDTLFTLVLDLEVGPSQ